MSKRRRPNKPKVWRAFTQNHPLWRAVIEMRNSHATWGNILKYTAERSYPLTQRQIEFGLQKAGIDYAHHVVPWIQEAADEFVETSLPALEYAQAALLEQAKIITNVEHYCDTVWAEYEALAEPVEGETAEQATVRAEARETARERWQRGSSKRYSMMTEYLTNLINFRRAMTDLLPAEAVRKMESEEKGMAVTASSVLAIQDQDVFWREARILERTVRRDFEIIIAAIKRGENVPELRPLGPSDDVIDGEAREVREETDDTEDTDSSG